MWSPTSPAANTPGTLHWVALPAIPLVATETVAGRILLRRTPKARGTLASQFRCRRYHSTLDTNGCRVEIYPGTFLSQRSRRLRFAEKQLKLRIWALVLKATSELLTMILFEFVCDYYPVHYDKTILRTLQRRIKIWKTNVASDSAEIGPRKGNHKTSKREWN